jgi:hypothetical protein
MGSKSLEFKLPVGFSAASGHWNSPVCGMGDAKFSSSLLCRHFAAIPEIDSDIWTDARLFMDVRYLMLSGKPATRNAAVPAVHCR